MCSKTRTKKVIVGLAVVVLIAGCMFAYQHYLPRYYMADVTLYVLFYFFYAVVPVIVLIINVLLVREVRRAVKCCKRRQSRTSSPVNLVQFRRAHGHGHRHFTRPSTALFNVGNSVERIFGN